MDLCQEALSLFGHFPPQNLENQSSPITALAPRARAQRGAGHLGHGAGSGLGQPQDCLRTTSGQPQDNYRTTSGQPQDNLRATSTRYSSACSNPNRAWGACANTDVVDNSNVLSNPGPDNPRIVSQDNLRTVMRLSS